VRTASADVTVIVVTWQARNLLESCLESLRAQTATHRLLVVDNASLDGTVKLLKSYPEAHVIALAHNTGFAGGVAAALPHVDTRFVALLNNDAQAEPGWLTAATAYLDANEDVAAVSCRMLLPGDPARINNAGVVLRPDGYGADRGLGELDGPAFDHPVEVFGASGGAAVYRTLAVKAVGGIEPQFFLYYEDTDLSWRLRLAGWRIDYCPDSVARHRHGASSQPGSPSFAFHTERNRLLTLARCAPGWFVAVATCRFVLTTLSLAVRTLRREPLSPSAVFSPAVRARALVSAVGLTPRLLGVRWSSSRRRRAEVLRRWRGNEALPLGRRGSPAV